MHISVKVSLQYEFEKYHTYHTCRAHHLKNPVGGAHT